VKFWFVKNIMNLLFTFRITRRKCIVWITTHS